MKQYLNNLYMQTKEELQNIIKKNLINNKKMFIITVNPETLMIAEKNPELKEIVLNKKNTIVPDGIGIIKACKKLKMKIPNKIPGIDIANYLLETANNYNKKIFLLGSTKEINDRLVEKIKIEYPKINIVGHYDGYINNKNEKIKEAIKNDADIIMVALGIPNQEILINSIYKQAKKGIFIGVGGSFDVISGYKKRAPKIFLKTNTEWLYRIIKEPKRIKRFYTNNIKFLFKLKK